ncbi:MAG: D-alanyl-D-alanine carboxypeptidase family protein [Gemmatimonadota bacterium]|nr:D-alanyl-D-alanine carboxypeptidase family protein [Gemmatimonadota bacterium]
MRLSPSALIPALLIALCSGCGREATAHPAKNSGVATSAAPRDSSQLARRWPADVGSYSGTDAHGIPHYLTRPLSEDARRVLRDAYGIVSASHLYISDSTPDGLLKYDPQPKPCSTCYVNSYRIGFLSIRKPGESWDQLERRVRTLRRSSFTPSSLVSSSSVSSMDPDVQAEVSQMLDAARRAGFHLRVVNTYRSPQQEAILMAEGSGRTHTLTSLHSYGRAIDVRVGDGNLNNSSTRRSWIAFRRWVTHFRGRDFRTLGPPDRSWDWPHVELPSDRIGFRSVDEAIATGRACLAKRSGRGCEFLPNLTRAR